MSTSARLLPALLASLALMPHAPAAAQARFETITYEALSDGSGVRITFAPEGQAASEQGGAVTSASVARPAKASATGIGVSGNEDSTATTKAPPDGPAQAKNGSGFGPMGPAALQISGEGGAATSTSEAEDRRPSSQSTAQFGKTTVGSAGPLMPVTIKFGPVATAASATGAGNRASSSAVSDEVGFRADVASEALQSLSDEAETALCTGLAGLDERLKDPCKAAFLTDEDQVNFFTARIGRGEVACSWRDETPAATGTASVVRLTVLGVELPEIGPGQAQTIGTDTALETLIGAGAFTKEIEDGGDNQDDTVSAIAGGAFIDMFGGQAKFRFSASSCSIEAKVATDEVLAATGGTPLLPMAAGAALVGLAVAIRRFLRRRDAIAS